MYQDSAPKLSWFLRRRVLSIFIIHVYGHGGHLDKWTLIIQTNFQKEGSTWFEENWLRGFRGEVIQGCGRATMDGRRHTAITIARRHKTITIAHAEPSAQVSKKMYTYTAT